MPIPGYCLGALPRIHRPEMPHLSALVAGKQLAPIPPSLDWAAYMPDDLGMFGNDLLGDCGDAALYHARQLNTLMALGHMDTQPDSTVIGLYEKQAGYVPGKPETDRGSILQNLLAYVLHHGLPLADGSAARLLAVIEIDPRNPEDVRRAIAECGSVYVGTGMPKFVFSGKDPAKLWSGPINAPLDGGHCIICPSYDPQGFGVISWGAKDYRMDLKFWSNYVYECYGLLWLDWVSAGGRTPFGLSVADWESQMQAIKASWQS